MDKKMRDFDLEVFFSKHEFTARHHMTASDFESMCMSQLLALASPQDKAALDDLWLGYTETWGAPDLRDEIARTYEKLLRANILCFAGAGEGLYAVARVLLDSTDHAIVPTPNYQSAETVPLSVCEVSGVPMRRASNWPDNSDAGSPEWSLDIDEIRAALRPNTRLISINSPQKPTGMLLQHEAFDALIALCRENGIYLLCDEVYRGVELDETVRLPQIADVYERGISLNVMSKAYGLPGLRIGWIASQDTDLLQKLESYKHYLSICNSGPSERLSVIALKAKETLLQRNKEILRRNMQLIEQVFADFPGLAEYQHPMGGCVAFPKYIGPGSGEAFCQDLLEKSGIIVLPSSIYASEIGDVPQDHFRIGIGRDQTVVEGIAAMRRHFETYFPEFAR